MIGYNNEIEAARLEDKKGRGRVAFKEYRLKEDLLKPELGRLI